MPRVLSSLLLLTFAASCDFKPPPKKAPPAPAVKADPTPAPDAAVAMPPAGSAAPVAQGSGSAGSGSGSAKLEPRADCVEVSQKMAGALIDSMTDVAQKAAFEQDRVKIVRRAADTCTKDNWAPAVIACLRAASTMPDMQNCTRDLKAPSQG